MKLHPRETEGLTRLYFHSKLIVKHQSIILGFSTKNSLLRSSKQFPKDIDQTDLHRRDILEFEADITKNS